MSEIETRAVGDFAAEGRTLTGYGIMFDSPTHIAGFQERFRPGSFSNSIAKDDIRLLIEHLPHPVLARSRSGTLRVWDDGRGLRVTAELPDTRDAEDLLVSVRRGDKTGMSVGFITVQDNWEDGLRSVTEAALVEVSVVTFPAYEDAEVAARSAKRYESLKFERESIKLKLRATAALLGKGSRN